MLKISLQSIIILMLTLAGFALRLHYLATSHPFFDEYTTVLAARQVLHYGRPILPSGLFYEHGLLATYLAAPFVALFIHLPLDQWQPAHWGLMLARWPSLLLGTATIPLVYRVGANHGDRRAGGVGLLAAGLFAFSPEGMVWGGRARMYALATLLVLLAVERAYRGARHPGPARYRWQALLLLAAALFTQLGVLLLVPPLLVGMVTVGWFTRPPAARPWFLRRSVLLEGTALAGVLGLAILIKRLGRPLGAEALAQAGGGLLPELLHTVTYQAALHFTWADTVAYLARQFGVAHHYWPALLTLAGAAASLLLWVSGRRRSGLAFIGYLWLVFGLVIVEMVTLLEPFRRNPRYVVMYLPLFYLLAAGTICCPLAYLFDRLRADRLASPLAALSLLALLTGLGLPDLRLALLTPEPAYEQALAYVWAEWQPGDRLLTMNTPAAGLYLGYADGFTVQAEAEQFLLNSDTAPVDRWLGVPWVGTAAQFSTALAAGERAWFVIDTIRQPVYFRGDWLAVVQRQMGEPAWAGDNALVYRTRPDPPPPLPGHPATPLEATLGQAVRLLGYSAQPQAGRLQVVLFWQPLSRLEADYTTFIHLRDRSGATVAQHDGQPLGGAYPTGQWQPGETVIDPVELPLPPGLPAGTYTLWTGLYRLDTLERLPVANDTSGENAVRLGQVKLP